MSSSSSIVIPEYIIFEILQWIHPCIYLIISKNLFRTCSKPDKEKLTISLLIALNNTSTFEEFPSVVLSSIRYFCYFQKASQNRDGGFFSCAFRSMSLHGGIVT
jgi:hypothetical protein